ncbi:hypothetical protein V3481_019573 [Fusarium oxysporum f. sp. vasinfectum]
MLFLIFLLRVCQDLERTLQHLVSFISASGFQDVDFRNIPILDQAYVSNTAPKIALVDLKNCGELGQYQRWTYDTALFGTDTIRGLFGCIAPQSFPAVKEAALFCGIDLEALYPGMYSTSFKKGEREFEAACRSLEGVADTETFQREVKRIFDTVATSLSVDVLSNHPQLATEPLDEFDVKSRLHSGRLASRRFEATVVGVFLRKGLLG